MVSTVQAAAPPTRQPWLRAASTQRYRQEPSQGQDSNRYLVLDVYLLDQLDGVTCSPFGAVQKGDIPLAEDARVIHDLSYPPGDSVNDHTAVGSTIDISYDGAVSIARRIVEVEDAFPGRARMMAGDVSGAFRHILLHASAVGRFAGTIPSLGVLIIDLACPFGWTDSLGHYWVAGSAIKHIYGSSAPRWPFQRTVGAADFDATAWCDDHISVEPDVGSRLDEAGLALRSAMVQVLGPDACNVDKFTEWFTRGQALGLCWDLHQATVSIPANKIAKAEGRLLAMLATRTTTRKALNELLGSLRHVCSCVRSATAFVQSIGDLSRSTSCSRRVINSEAAKDDVRWFLVVLRTARLNSIPLTRFAAVQSPDWHIFMDASDRGLCALFPARREYLQVEFTEDAQARIRAFNSQGTSDFGINLRELLSATFASIMWGPGWGRPGSRHHPHVRFWIDNRSAVAWANKQRSRNPGAQMLLRRQSLLEAKYYFFTSAAHIPGADNIMADAGSRVWQSPSLATTFTNLSHGWVQVTIPPDWRQPSMAWARFCAQEL